MEFTPSKHRFFAFSLCLMASFLSPLKAESTRASFLQKTPSARLSSLGGNQAAIDGTLDSVFSNPAGLTSLQMPELFLAHSESLLDTQYETLGFGFSRGKQAFGMVGQYSTLGRFDRTGIDSGGLPVSNLGDFRPFQSVFQLTWARSIHRSFSFGLTGKGWWERLDQKTENGLAMDAGVQATGLLPHMSWGAAVKNAGPQKNNFDLPTTYSFGGAYKIQKGLLKSFSLLSEYEIAAKRSDALRTGVEFRQKLLQLRAGYAHFTSDKADELGNFSLGGGVRINGWRFDYAWKESDTLGEEHQFSLTLGFGLTPDQLMANARKLDEAMANRIKFRADNHFRAGELAFNSTNWSLAIHEYTQALNWDPNHSQAEEKLLVTREKQIAFETNRLYKKGLTQMKKGKAIEAALSFREALKLNPENKEVGRALKKAKKRFSKSRKSLREYERKAKARAVNPPLSTSSKQQGNKQMIENLSQNAYTFYMLGNIQEASKIWENILILDPSNSDAQWALKQLSENQSPLSQSHTNQSSRKVTELHSTALRSYSKGDYKQALLYWKKALKLDPRNIRIRNSIMRVEKEISLGGR